MRVFVESKERFIFRMRQQEVLDGVRCHGLLKLPEPAEVAAALTQLCEWGNLERLVDTADVARIEDFYHPPQVFQMTGPGEAVELALETFHSSLAGGVVQAGKVSDVRFVLQELRQLSQLNQPDAGTIYRNLLALRASFEDLSSTTMVFIADLERWMDSPPADLKQLIEAAQEFVEELVLETDTIAETFRDIDAAAFERLLEPVARRRACEKMDDGKETAAIVSERWRSFWNVFRSWFISRPDRPSNAEMLRQRARAALTVLLRILKTSNDPRSPRIDRTNDFRVLARWFAEAESDSEAHLLWRAAFGLCPARHLIVNDLTLDDREAEDVPVHTSWLNAPPLRISTALEDHRRLSRTGGLSRIVDRSAEKEKLAAASHQQAQRLLNAQRRFGTGNRIRLSELEHLEADEFEVLLDLVGEAVSARVSPLDSVEILSGDGCLKVKLEPTNDGREASILTTGGVFSGLDHWISIEPITTDDVLEVLM